MSTTTLFLYWKRENELVQRVEYQQQLTFSYISMFDDSFNLIIKEWLVLSLAVWLVGFSLLVNCYQVLEADPTSTQSTIATRSDYFVMDNMVYMSIATINKLEKVLKSLGDPQTWYGPQTFTSHLVCSSDPHLTLGIVLRPSPHTWYSPQTLTSHLV